MDVICGLDVTVISPNAVVFNHVPSTSIFIPCVTCAFLYHVWFCAILLFRVIQQSVSNVFNGFDSGTLPWPVDYFFNQLLSFSLLVQQTRRRAYGVGAVDLVAVSDAVAFATVLAEEGGANLGQGRPVEAVVAHHEHDAHQSSHRTGLVLVVEKKVIVW